MTCAQGLLRLLWGGGAEVGVVRDCLLLSFNAFMPLAVMCCIAEEEISL